MDSKGDMGRFIASGNSGPNQQCEVLIWMSSQVVANSFKNILILSCLSKKKGNIKKLVLPIFVQRACLLFSHHKPNFWLKDLKDFVHCADQAQWPWAGKEVIFRGKSRFCPTCACNFSLWHYLHWKQQSALEGRVNTNWVAQFIFGLQNMILHPDTGFYFNACRDVVFLWP